MVGLKIPQPDRTHIHGIPVDVRRSRRRRTRIGLAFDPAGFVIVEAPMDASEREIHALIREHSRWLRHRLDKVINTTGLTACLRYADGELVHYLGDPYELTVRDGRRPGVVLKERRCASAAQLGLFESTSVRGELRVTVSPTAGHSGLQAAVRDAVVGWYLAQAGERFARELEAWRFRLPWLKGRTPLWRHRFMRSQWGSCSRSGRISLNTHLIKTPPRLIEYVILHELCHLRHYDHSRRFYGLMSRHMPDWESRRGELDHYLPVLLQE